MILNEYITPGFVFEQVPVQPGMDQQPEPEQGTEGDPPEFTPLKKFYIVQKLYDLKSQLSKNSIESEELNTILQFGSELGYDTVLRLADSVINIVKLQLQGVNKDDKQK